MGGCAVMSGMFRYGEVPHSILYRSTAHYSGGQRAQPLPPSTIDGHNHGHHPTFVAAATTTTTIAFVIASAIAVVSAYTDRADDINLSLHLLEVVGVTT